jgi:hypothetical protein
MKVFIIGTLSALFALTAFAQTYGKVKTATQEEKIILCEAVKDQLETEFADAAVDAIKCGKRSFKSRVITEGIVEVTGRVPFTSPNREYKLTCTVAYDAGKAAGENLIGEPVCK